MDLSPLHLSLPRKAQRGSKPRCHFITHGTADEVASRLTALAAPWAEVSPTDRWMPAGFEQRSEAQLHRSSRLLDDATRAALGAWWLPAHRQDARTPNWDIASTCRISGRPGLLLMEAKAHDQEFLREAVGRRLDTERKGDKQARADSHVTIGAAIAAAREGLNSATGLQWTLARNQHYQLSNRFAWCWKLATLGIPVVLVYLGFLEAAEMSDMGRPFRESIDWEALVRENSPAVPGRVWSNGWLVEGMPFIPVIQSALQPLPQSPDRGFIAEVRGAREQLGRLRRAL